MEDLLEQGFNPDIILKKLGNERLEEKLQIVGMHYGTKPYTTPQRNTEQWAVMEQAEARNIPISDAEIDALLDAGANPQYVVDALQRVTPEDGVDNPSS